MTRLLFVVCISISLSSLHAEEVDQAVIDEIREIRESMTLGEALEGDDEAFKEALITVVTDDSEEASEPESDVEAEVCPNGGSCCENVASKVIAKALAAQLTPPPQTPPKAAAPPKVVQPGKPVLPAEPYWMEPPRVISNNQQIGWGSPAPHPPRMQPPHHTPHHDEEHRKIHMLRETAFELERIAHRLEMTNLFEAADEIRETAHELREEAREIIEGDHEDHDHDHDEEHDHED